MTISTNDAVDKFGTTDTVSIGTGTSAVSDGAMSASGDVVSGGWTNDDDVSLATVVLTWQYPSGTINGKINLHLRSININGTTDEPQPSTSSQTGYVQTFDVATTQSATTDTSYKVLVRLPNEKTSSAYEFYVYNDSGVTMTAGWTLKVTPLGKGPKA